MDWVSQLGAVLLVLALLAAVLWLLRRRGVPLRLGSARPAGHRLQYLERMPLGPQHTLHVVRLGTRGLLLASSPAGCALLKTVPLEEIEPAPEARR